MDFSLPILPVRIVAGGQFIDVAALEFTPSTDVNESLTMAYKDDTWNKNCPGLGSSFLIYVRVPE